jgi:ataxia telangiectasia mutated family protein
MPEIIPFRLTRDIVDGFGPVGTEGTFVATAVTTLAVLRENTNALMTILSAVVSDPLYKWCINPLTARLRQRDESEDGKNDPLWISNGKSNNPSTTERSTHSDNPDTTIEMENDAASRTLATIVKKLQGFEDGSSGESQTVEGQVRMLIQAAKNPDNLCQMYCGWAPWL